MKKKPISSKQNWQATRERYRWHLVSPFKEKFDSTHWWKNQPESKINKTAALYELVRRHPLVGEVMTSYTQVWGNDAMNLQPVFDGRLKELIREKVKVSSLYWTCLNALNSWETLDYTDRRNPLTAEEWEAAIADTTFSPRNTPSQW